MDWLSAGLQLLRRQPTDKMLEVKKREERIFMKGKWRLLVLGMTNRRAGRVFYFRKVRRIFPEASLGERYPGPA